MAGRKRRKTVKLPERGLYYAEEMHRIRSEAAKKAARTRRARKVAKRAVALRRDEGFMAMLTERRPYARKNAERERRMVGGSRSETNYSAHKTYRRTLAWPEIFIAPYSPKKTRKLRRKK